MLLISTLRGNEQTPPNYSRALRILCTAKGDNEFLGIIQVLAETLLAYQGSLDIQVNEQAGATKRAAIHYTAIGGNQQLYNLLIRHGANPELLDSSNTTASQYLARALTAQTAAATPSNPANSAPTNPVDDHVRNLSKPLFNAGSPLTKGTQPEQRNQMTNFASTATQQILKNYADTHKGTEQLQQFLSGQANPQQLAATQQAMAGAGNILAQFFSPESMARIGHANDQDIQALTREFTQRILNNVNASRQQMGLPPEQLPEIRTPENTKVPEGDLSGVRADLISDLTLAAEDQDYDLDAFWQAINNQQYVNAIRAGIRSQNENVVEMIKILLGYQTRLGFSVNTQDPLTGHTPLHESVMLRGSLDLYMIMVGAGGDSLTIRDRQGKSAGDLKLEKLAGAYVGAQGNPTTFVHNIGINTNEAQQQPKPPSYQAPHPSASQQDAPEDNEDKNSGGYYAPPQDYGRGK